MRPVNRIRVIAGDEVVLQQTFGRHVQQQAIIGCRIAHPRLYSIANIQMIPTVSLRGQDRRGGRHWCVIRIAAFCAGDSPAHAALTLFPGSFPFIPTVQKGHSYQCRLAAAAAATAPQGKRCRFNNRVGRDGAGIHRQKRVIPVATIIHTAHGKIGCIMRHLSHLDAIQTGITITVIPVHTLHQRRDDGRAGDDRRGQRRGRDAGGDSSRRRCTLLVSDG